MIVGTGARYQRLDVDRLVDFEGEGVYYAATTIETRECDGSPVIVVGRGNSAGQAAVLLAESDSPVTVIIRGPDLNASMSRYLVDRLDAHELIDLRANARIVGLDGDEMLTSGRVAGENGDATLACAGLFSFIGAEPASEWLSGCAALDERSFVLTDLSLSEEHLDGRWARVGTAAASIRDESSRSLRRRRRPRRLDQTGGCSRWRRIGGGAIRPRVPRPSLTDGSQWRATCWGPSETCALRL